MRNKKWLMACALGMGFSLIASGAFAEPTCTKLQNKLQDKLGAKCTIVEKTSKLDCTLDKSLNSFQQSRLEKVCVIGDKTLSCACTNES